MKKELEESLRRMQANPTTGTPHNQQVISTQVETIFILDELNGQIKQLNKNIEESDKQSRRLEVSNYRLQWAMLILTAIATMIVAYPIIKIIFNWVAGFFKFGAYSETIIRVVSAVIATATGIIPLIIMRRLGAKKFDKEMDKFMKILNGVD